MAEVLDLATARERRAGRTAGASGEPGWRLQFRPETSAEIAALLRELAADCTAIGAETCELAALLAPAEEP